MNERLTEESYLPYPGVNMDDNDVELNGGVITAEDYEYDPADIVSMPAQPSVVSLPFDASKYDNSGYSGLAEIIRRAQNRNSLNAQIIEDVERRAEDNRGYDPEKYQEFMADIRRIKDAASARAGDVARVDSLTGERQPSPYTRFNTQRFTGKKFEGTTLFQDAVRIKEAAQEGKSEAEIEALRQQIYAEWASRDPDVYTFELTQEFRDEFEIRRNEASVRQSIETFRSRRERESNNPRSIQQVAAQIIQTEGEDRWGIDGKYPLLNPDYTLNQQNFLRWARERIIYHHSNNSRDPQLALPNLIGVDNPWGNTINVFSMEKNRNQYFRDQLTGRIYDNLADQLKMEIWLFGSMRNYDLIYKQYMGQDEKLPEFLGNVHAKEEITLSDSFERMLKMSDEFGSGDTKVGDAFREAWLIYYNISDVKKLKEMLGEDSSLFSRDAFMDALRILSKKKGTEALEAEHQAMVDELFDQEGKIKNMTKFEQVINPFNEQNKNEFQISLSREMVRRIIAERYGLEYGLFLNPKEDVGANGKVRVPERQFARMNLEYAENFAWVLTRFTGAAARNDPEGIGFDAQTKFMKFLRSRRRQTASTRAGQAGNPFNFGVHKQLTEDFFNGVYIQETPEDGTLANLKRKYGIDMGNKRKTPFRVMMDLDLLDKEIRSIVQSSGTDRTMPWSAEELEASTEFTDEEKDNLIELLRAKAHVAGVRFDQSTQIGYTTNHLNRSASIFHGLMGGQEARLDQLVKWQDMGGGRGKWTIDEVKLEEDFKEKMVKAYRYAFSTYGMIDFGEIVRTENLEVQGRAGRDEPAWQDQVKADAWFGPIVTHDLKIEAKEEYKRVQKKVKQGKELTSAERVYAEEGLSDRDVWRKFVRGDGRSALWKRALMARIAMDLKSHRVAGKKSAKEYMDYEQVELFYKALESITELQVANDDTNELVFSQAGHFFTEKELNWIRKHSKTEKWRLYATGLAPDIASGFATGLWKGAKEFVESGFK